MAEYMRKIIYLRKKEGGMETSGSGYIRLERRGDEFRVHLTMPVGQHSGKLPVYAVYEKNNELYPLLLGTTEGEAEWEYFQYIDTKKMDWYAEDILGFIIGTENSYLVGESPDYRGINSGEKISFEQIHFQKNEKKEPPEVEIKTDYMDKSLSMEAASEEPKEGFVNNLTEIYPFEDDELEWCYAMVPKDFSFFPMEYWHYAKNTFLLQGFYNYRHLLYAHKEGKNYLGVPGQFHRRDQFLAGQFGFPLFKSTKKKRTTMGDFGYWMKELD